ncbi:MAG: hypothetical protein WCQ47_09210 [bacterium]
MSFKDKKQEITKISIFGGSLGEKIKKSIPDRINNNTNQKLPDSVRRGKSTKSFNRKRAGR